MILLAKYLHLLGTTVWVGGMFFAYMILRPVAAARLDAPARLALWEGVLAKFFAWVWVAVVLILASGVYRMGQLGRPPHYVLAMFASGVLMMLIFGYVFFVPWRRLREAVAAQDWPAGGAALGRIRRLVGINLLLGLLTMAFGALGPLF